MNTTTKLLAPMAFALAAASAHAGVFNLEYPTEQIKAAEAAGAEQGSMVGIGGTLRIANNQSPVIAKDYDKSMDPSREDVLRKAEQQPLEFDDPRYFQ